MLSLVLALSLLAGCAGDKKENPAPVNKVNNNNKNNYSPSSNDSANNNNSVISEEDAIEIALEHAGFSESEVSRLHAEYDYDDGFYKYEVDFRQGMYEYDYEINAENGNIISYDKDYDD